MDQPTQKENSSVIVTAIDNALQSIEHEREREIIARRFGLHDRKETLEQIGEMLGITRERVRQLEKSILIRLKMAVESNKIDNVNDVEKILIRDLSENGRISKINDVTDRIVGANHAPKHRSHIAFISELSGKITVVNENDQYHHAASISEYGDEKAIKKNVDELVKTIKKHGEPIHIEALHDKLSYEHPSHVNSTAMVSKKLAQLEDHWGLAKWPTVNPKNIRDKIYVVLASSGKPLHFTEIAEAIRDSNFKRNDVTPQAIHNELIKDSRFVLIGRGIYALDTWGYSQGTVTDIITEVLREAGEPLHREEIIRRVLAKRLVKETTILLNLQSKPQFKRTSKATYSLVETETK